MKRTIERLADMRRSAIGRFVCGLYAVIAGRL